MKIFAVSDIHGCYTLLREALDRAGFDKNDPEHLLVGCGDYFDRGAENRKVLSFLERVPNKVLLRGNHEDMLLRLLQTERVSPVHYANGTVRTVEDFFGKYAVNPDSTLNLSGNESMREWVISFITELRDYYETQQYIFVHGWLPSGCDTPEKRAAATPEAWEKARWDRWTEQYRGQAPLKGKTLVCGHVPTLYGSKFDPSRERSCADIFRGAGMIAIDGGACDTKQLNVLVLETDKE